MALHANPSVLLNLLLQQPSAAKQGTTKTAGKRLVGIDTRMSEHFNCFFPFLVLVLLKGNTAFVQASCLLSGISVSRKLGREAEKRPSEDRARC